MSNLYQEIGLSKEVVAQVSDVFSKYLHIENIDLIDHIQRIDKVIYKAKP